jgi:hypothetical protein
VTTVTDREAVIDVVNSFFVAVDDRDWRRARACMADRVHFDMTTAGAGPASEMMADDIVAGWQSGLAKIEHVHHHSGNFLVKIEGDRADCFCYATAYHYRRVRSGKNLRLFVGSYDYRLARQGSAWRITQFKFNLKFIDGNRELDQEEPS